MFSADEIVRLMSAGIYGLMPYPQISKILLLELTSIIGYHIVGLHTTTFEIDGIVFDGELISDGWSEGWSNRVYDIYDLACICGKIPELHDEFISTFGSRQMKHCNRREIMIEFIGSEISMPYSLWDIVDEKFIGMHVIEVPVEISYDQSRDIKEFLLEESFETITDSGPANSLKIVDVMLFLGVI